MMLRTRAVSGWALFSFACILLNSAPAWQRSNDANVQGAIDRQNAKDVDKQRSRQPSSSTSRPSSGASGRQTLCSNGRWVNNAYECPKSAAELAAEKRAREEAEANNQRLRDEAAARERANAPKDAEEAYRRSMDYAIQQAAATRALLNPAAPVVDADLKRVRELWNARTGLPSSQSSLLNALLDVKQRRRTMGGYQEVVFYTGLLQFELAEENRLRGNAAAAIADIDTSFANLVFVAESDAYEVTSAAKQMVKRLIDPAQPYKSLLPADFEQRARGINPFFKSSEYAKDLKIYGNDPMAYDLDNRSAAIRSMLGTAAVPEGNPAEQCALLKPVSSPSEMPEALSARGYEYQIRYQSAEKQAKACFRQALVLDPNHRSSLAAMAGILKQEGNHREAAALLRKLIGLEPAMWNYVNLAEELAATGELDEARKFAELGLAKATGNSQARSRLEKVMGSSQYLASNVMPPPAPSPAPTPVATPAPQVSAPSATVLDAGTKCPIEKERIGSQPLEELYAGRGGTAHYHPERPDLNLARNCYEEALRVNPNHAHALYMLATWHQEQAEMGNKRADLRVAAEMYRRYIPVAPQPPQAGWGYLHLAECELALGHPAEARTAAEEAKRLNPAAESMAEKVEALLAKLNAAGAK